MPNYKRVSYGYTRHNFLSFARYRISTQRQVECSYVTLSHNFNMLFLRHCTRKKGKVGPVVTVGYRRTFCCIMMDIWSAAKAQWRQWYGKVDCWMCFLLVTNSDLFFFPSSLFRRLTTHCQWSALLLPLITPQSVGILRTRVGQSQRNLPDSNGFERAIPERASGSADLFLWLADFWSVPVRTHPRSSTLVTLTELLFTITTYLIMHICEFTARLSCRTWLTPDMGHVLLSPRAEYPIL